ncbi:CD248 molecule, endosialin a [Oreochromis niloticus]|uniref:CD248 molecule, endosialin a n=1 Tax=Oreochromis niloticus TaxID=8128 RepID=I3J149_ORENI|nr:endosialin-like [Oreochromis niloticus]
MGSLVSSALLLTSLLALLFGFSSVLAQNLRQRDALCNTDGCFVVYFQRKTFLESWKACKEKDGNLATIKRKVDATAIATLFSTVDLRHSRTTVQVWFGLQRQPRQCATSPRLRGFSWTTGDQDTEYTDWQKPDSPDSCSVPRCVFMGYSTEDQDNNFKWIDSACAVSADGYLCHYAYAGMCPPLWSEGEGNVTYTTPFNLVSTLLTHVPVGSVATVRCPSGAKEEKTVSCMTREDGSVGWTKESPLCSHFSISRNLCEKDNDQMTIMPDYGQFYCECADGYMLAPDERTCLDVDECLGSPCEQICVNALGTFECQCHEGYYINDKGECEDIDECINDPCEHACENTPGSHICHCHLGYSLVPEHPSQCQDINECEIPGTCEQMCVNYEGGFECYCSEGFELMSDNYSCEEREEGDDRYAVTPPFPWVTGQAGPLWDYDWNPEQRHTDWSTHEEESLNWLTESTRVLNSDVIWATSAPLEKLFSDSVLDPLTQGTDEDEEEAVERADWSNGGQRSQSELKVLSPTAYNTPHLLSSSATPDSYKEDAGEATTALPLYLTSTISDGAWNWQAALVTSSKIPLDSVTDMPKESGYHKEPEGETQRNLLRENFQFTEAELSKEEMTFVEFTPSQNLAFPTGLASSQPPPTEDEGGDDSSDSVQKKGSIWLMVGLFIPICIFIVVMVALGFVYCNRYRVTAHDKNTADCYHWISGSHDKQGAPDPSAGVQSCV